MSYLGKMMARSQPAGMNHVNYQYGASNRYQNMQMQMMQMQFEQQMAMYQMMNTPQYTIHTHEKQKHGGFFGGIWDAITSGVGAYTGKEIGGYTDTITTTGGFGPSQTISLSSNGGWGSTIGSALGGAFKQSGVQATSSQKTQSSDNHKADCESLKSLNPDYNIIYRDGQFMASSKDGSKTITAETFSEMDKALKEDKTKAAPKTQNTEEEETEEDA